MGRTDSIKSPYNLTPKLNKCNLKINEGGGTLIKMEQSMLDRSLCLPPRNSGSHYGEAEREGWSPLVAEIPGPTCRLFGTTPADAWTRPLEPGDNLAALAKWS